jgi:hypothetical protein
MIANGVAQLVMAVARFLHSAKLLDLHFPTLPFSRNRAKRGSHGCHNPSGSGRPLEPLAAIAVGVVAGGAVFLFMLR